MTWSELSIRNLNVIVTGAGRGLGRALALGLAEAGAKVIIAGRTEADLSSVSHEIEREGGIAFPFRFNAENAPECEKLIAFARDQLGEVHGIIINHGVTLHQSAYDTSAEDFRHVIDINLTSSFLCARAAGRQMRKQATGGSIVLMSSNASFLAYDNLVAYGASKGGLDQLCRQLGAEWAPDCIRVNAIGPGYMNSHMRGVEGGYEDPKIKDRIIQQIPMKRRGDPHELLGASIYFLSPASSYATGQYIAIDGGYSLI